MFQQYDIIIVGAGHAGCEAAVAAAKLGAKVLLVTFNMNTMGQMSCNPAMGGIAKGQIVREIDALGGMSGIVTDRSMIQFRMLNRSKGAAMWSPRAQVDRTLFTNTWRSVLENIPNIHFWQDKVQQILVKNHTACGVVTSMGHRIKSKAVILTNGTFLNGLIHVGKKQLTGGRLGEQASIGITEQLIKLGFETGRLKTGTPPRIDGRSLSYSKMEEQKGDEIPEKFSFSEETKSLQHQKSCFIAYTNQKTHTLLKKHLKDSPMFSGDITGTGPRYCPSIEDKLHRFADKERHQLFIEPEGWNTIEIYVNGFSTSLPAEIQYQGLCTIPGFEKVKMFRPGYAIEYDYFPPTQLKPTLETNQIQNLYFAGQINGTTGYEEAACQGLMVGINAYRKLIQKPPFILSRAEAYIGVLIDDLISKGTDEPYRMFTSRAEFRILLRQDNADLRLSERAYQMGLLEKERLDALQKKKSAIECLTREVKIRILEPEEINPMLEKLHSQPIKEKKSLQELLKRPELNLNKLCKYDKINKLMEAYHPKELEQVEINLKYAHYLEREQELVQKLKQLENYHIPKQFNYELIKGLSAEAKEKLKKIQPITIGQAQHISGVTPADITILMTYMGK